MHDLASMNIERETHDPNTSQNSEHPGAAEATTDSKKKMQSAPEVEHAARGGLSRVTRFAREHPAVSVLGAAGIALFGGIDIALGVLVGAAVAAFAHVEKRDRSQAADDAAAQARGVRDRARSLFDHEIKDRARAIVEAARNKIASEPGEDRAPEARQPR